MSVTRSQLAHDRGDVCKAGIAVDHTTIHCWVITYAPNAEMMLTLTTIGTTNHSAWHAE